MSPANRSPWFTAALLALALAAAGAGWCGWTRAQAATKAEKRRNQLRAEWATLRRVTPAPTADSAAKLEAELTEANTTLAQMRAALAGRRNSAAGAKAAAASRTETYFEVASFVERLRDRARQAGVRVRADEYFGFATHAHEGPDADILATVRRQHEVAEFVVGALIDGRAQQIVAVQRERPVPGAASGLNGAEGTSGRALANAAVASGGERGGAADFFELDGRGSARVPGFVDTLALRVVFVGETDALRVLLNKLAEFELPIVVRSVEAEPADLTATVPGAVAPLVARRATRFTVTVECVQLASEPAKA